MPHISVTPHLKSSVILWVSDEGSTLSPRDEQIKRELHSKKVKYISPDQSFHQYQGELIEAIVVNMDFSEEISGEELLLGLRSQFAHVPMILLFHRQKIEDLAIAVNNIRAHAVFGNEHSSHEIAKRILDACRLWNHRIQEHQTSEELKRKNRFFEKLNLHLGQLSQHRTLEWRNSRRETERQLKEMGRLTQWVKNLAGIFTIEEVMQILREEVKHFHDIREPILGCTLPHQAHHLYFFRGSKVQDIEVSQIWPPGLAMRLNDSVDRQYLANTFSRPFGPLIVIPFSLAARGELNFRDQEASVLFFEVGSPHFDPTEFIHFIRQRIQPIMIVLDRIILEQELHNTSHLWEESFDCIDDPIAIVDYQHRLLRSNRSFSENLVSKKCYEEFSQLGEACAGCPLPQAMDRGVPVVAQVKRNQQIFEVHAYPIRLIDNAKVTSVVNYYLDVTKAQSLQAQVAQREKIAAVGHLAGHIAHELNNPLTGIRSTAQILLHDQNPGTRLYSDLVEVEKAAHRCQEIIRNLIDFSREENQVPRQLVELNDIVAKTLPLLKTAMYPFVREIEFTHEDTQVSVEPQLLQQVIFNIINNACQALGESGTIWITTHRETEDDQDFVDLRIRDSGEGIPPEIQGSIFDPFFTTKAEGKGTGLGLSMSLQVIQEFGGRIWVWSEPGLGTEFTLRLPHRGGVPG